jgi:hypothetical protein
MSVLERLDSIPDAKEKPLKWKEIIFGMSFYPGC